jgi:hypothetical protein
MGKRKKYSINAIDVSLNGTMRASWRYAGQTVHGDDYLYSVRDSNFGSLNYWIVAVRVPKRGVGDVVVQPRQPPGKRVWAGLERRSLVFVRATRLPYRNHRYCKVSLADPTGERTKHTVSRGGRTTLPLWLKGYRSRMRLKSTVAITRGHDGNAQVVIVNPEDYASMIKLYFALKVWVMQEAYQV